MANMTTRGVNDVIRMVVGSKGVHANRFEPLGLDSCVEANFWHFKMNPTCGIHLFLLMDITLFYCVVGMTSGGHEYSYSLLVTTDLTS